MKSLVIFQDPNKNLMLLQTQWKSALSPLTDNPSLYSIILPGISLSTGSNTVNHRLGRTQQGWRIVDINAAATIYRSAALNDQTLTLTASAPCTVSIEVF